MKIDEVKSLFSQAIEDALNALSSKFTEVPNAQCDCGKPVVFLNPRKHFTCSRCGKKWKLLVEVRQVTKG